MIEMMHDGEHHWLVQVVADLADDDLKLVYADWLESIPSVRRRYNGRSRPNP